MTTETQKIANQQNALISTGPKSQQGKINSSQNALKHGLLSKNLLIHDEKRKDLEIFREQIYSSLCPLGAIEILLTEKIVNAAWRLHRLTKIETSLCNRKDYHGTINPQDLFWGKSGDCLSSLSRYESALERNLYKALHELQRIQAMRMGQPVIAPIAIEFTHSSNEQIGFVS